MSIDIVLFIRILLVGFVISLVLASDALIKPKVWILFNIHKLIININLYYIRQVFKCTDYSKIYSFKINSIIHMCPHIEELFCKDKKIDIDIKVLSIQDIDTLYNFYKFLKAGKVCELGRKNPHIGYIVTIEDYIYAAHRLTMDNDNNLTTLQALRQTYRQLFNMKMLKQVAGIKDIYSMGISTAVYCLKLDYAWGKLADSFTYMHMSSDKYKSVW